MSPLFGNNDDRGAQQADADAAIEHLCTLSATALAEVILPAWARNAMRTTHYPAQDVARWLMDAYHKPPRYEALEPAIEEAIQVLELAGLLIRSISESGGSTLGLTRLGRSALVQGRIREHLPQRPAPLPPELTAQIPALHGIPTSVIGLAWSGRLPDAVQRYRHLTGADLRQATRVVRAVAESGGSPADGH